MKIQIFISGFRPITDDSIVSYDPQRGFILRRPPSYFGGSFKCKATFMKEDEQMVSETRNLHLEYDGKTVDIL